MDRFELDVRALRIPLLVMAVVATMAGALVWATAKYADEQNRSLDKARAELAVTRSEFRLALEADDIARTSQRRFQILEQRGFVGEEERLHWIESLRSAGEKQHLYKLGYKLQPRKALMPTEASGQHYQLYASSMQLQMELAHEIDLIRYFNRLEAGNTSIHVLQGCEIRSLMGDGTVSLSAANLSASCDLEWYTVRPLSMLSDEEVEL